VTTDERSREETRRHHAAAPLGASGDPGPPERSERWERESIQGGIRIDTFVAIGDSFTEGLDDFRPDGSIRGWADRLAELIAARQGYVNYANLAVRGRVLAQIVADQFPAALAARPDLATSPRAEDPTRRLGVDPRVLPALARPSRASPLDG
jgi:lysophospholipase L1-like esterase